MGEETRSETERFAACFRVQYPRLVALGVAMCGDYEVARELAQETFARAHGQWAEVAALDRPDAWLRKVMSNLLIDYHRRQTSELAAFDRLASFPTRAGDAREKFDDWARMVAPLAPQRRLVVTLHYGEDRSVADIADVLGISVNTVKSTLAKARVDLRRHLEAADG